MALLLGRYITPKTFFELSYFTCAGCTKQTIYAREFPHDPDIAAEHDEEQNVRTESSYSTEGVELVQLYPTLKLGEDPHADMPTEVRKLYDEARDVGHQSPRSAAALLRVALETLLKGSPYNLNGRLFDMVTQAAKRAELGQLWSGLEVVRIVGNEAAHETLLDLAADTALVDDLFGILNEMVEASITTPARRSERFSKMPETKQRDLSSET